MIKRLTDDMVLYHGSYCEVTLPDLTQCAKHKDFGKGFYLTSDIDQARAFAKISTAKAKNRKKISASQNMGFVTSYTLCKVEKLRICVYDNADEEWLRVIVDHRIGAERDELEQDVPYDVIAGKIANDNTNAILLTYMNGLYGEVGTDAAEKMCISLLLPERLKDQYCFRTERAIRSLHYQEVERVWL